MNNSDSEKGIWKGWGVSIILPIVTTLITLLVTRAFHIISPEENKVIISDTLRVVETQIPRNSNDSLLFIAISELNKTLRETAPRNNSVKILLPESRGDTRDEKQDTHSNSAVSTPFMSNSRSESTNSQGAIQDSNNYTNIVIDKSGFYKKGYTISDGGVFYVLNKRPKVDDDLLVFEIKLIQPSDLLSHIYLVMCNTNEKGELYQYFNQAYEVKDGLNRIKIANNLREGKNRIEIGVFRKADEGKDYPAFYRTIITLVK